MIGDIDIGTASVITGFFLLVGGIAVAFIQARGTRLAAHRLEESIDTGNGSKLGATVHRIEGAVELIRASQHTETRELVEVAAKVTALDEKLTLHMADVAAERANQQKG